MTDDIWPCQAYGSDGLAHGALCFVVAELNNRACESPAVCAAVMTGERQRIFRRINEMAASGDETFGPLEDEFPDPGQILNGGQDEG